MSRVGKSPITIPGGVTVTADASGITVAGGKGTLKQFAMPGITVKQEGEELLVTRSSDEPKVRARHGLMRALLNNMVTGVSQAFTKKLEINGVGYRAALQGADLKLNVGLSHDVMYKVPEGVQVAVEQNTITVTGIDRQKVGQVAAEIRALKKPEPYKGKGIKYQGERILRKSGKSGKEKA
jgi:large subunit ribosomal protein L6